jgi:hypothetical protein
VTVGWSSLVSLELRAARSLLGLSLALGVFGPLAVRLALERVGGPLSATADYAPGLATHPAAGPLLALLSLGLALVCVARLFPRDPARDRWLEPLPLDPRALAGARVAVAAAILVAAPLARALAHLGAHALLGDWPPGFGAWAAGLLVHELGQALLHLGVAVWFARSRRHGAFLAGTLAAGVGLLVVQVPGVWAGYDPLRWTQADFPQAARLGWCLAAAFALGRAVGWPGRPTRAPSALTRGRAVPKLVRALATALALALPFTVARGAISLADPAPVFPSARVTAHTERFAFRYPASAAELARPLVTSADATLAAVAGELGEVPAGPTLEIELAPGRGGGAAIGLGEEVGWQRYALAERVAEDALARRTRGRTRAWSRALGTLSQGIARNVAWRVSGVDPFWSRFQAAVLHSRRLLRLEELADARALVRGRGLEAAPALGEAFAEAVRLEGGPGALAKLVDAIAAARARPAPASPDACRALWEELVGATGVQAPRLEERFLEVVEDGGRDDPRGELELPRLDVALERQRGVTGWRVLAIPDRAVPPGWDVVCRVRSERPSLRDPATDTARRLGRGPSGAFAFLVRTGPFLGRPWVQLGLRRVDPPPLAGTLWEDWSAPQGSP